MTRPDRREITKAIYKGAAGDTSDDVRALLTIMEDCHITSGGVRIMLSLGERALYEMELDEPPGAKREYLRTARENTLRALRSVSKGWGDA